MVQLESQWSPVGTITDTKFDVHYPYGSVRATGGWRLEKRRSHGGERCWPGFARSLPFSLTDKATGSVYVAEEVIGGGGMGTVYRARRESDGSPLALKMTALPGDPVGEQFLRHESLILARLMHPGVVSMVASGDATNGQPYLATEFVRGVTLAKVIKERKRLAPPVAASICRQIAAAMHHVHLSGVVHRDLKPSNVMVGGVDGATWAIVLDFGISSSAEDWWLKRSDGSLLYMAPEQMLRQGQNHVADIYQLGLILFECLTGMLPFGRSFEEAVMYRITGDVLPEWCASEITRLSPGLYEILSGMLAREPDRRTATMLAVEESLKQAVHYPMN